MRLKQVQAMVIDRQAIHKSQAGIWKSDITIPDKLNLTSMGGARHMASVAVATPTSLLPHQHFTLLPLLATPKAHQIYTFNVFGRTIFENDYLPMLTSVPKFAPLDGKQCPTANNFSLICNFCGEYSTPKTKIRNVGTLAVSFSAKLSKIESK